MKRCHCRKDCFSDMNSAYSNHIDLLFDNSLNHFCSIKRGNVLSVATMFMMKVIIASITAKLQVNLRLSQSVIFYLFSKEFCVNS